MTDTLYQNKHYKVVLTPDGEKNYGIVNTSNGLTEASEDTLPGAFSVAEQMHRILEYSLWEEHARNMYPNPEDSPFSNMNDSFTFEMDSDDDDDPSVQ